MRRALAHSSANAQATSNDALEESPPPQGHVGGRQCVDAMRDQVPVAKRLGHAANVKRPRRGILTHGLIDAEFNHLVEGGAVQADRPVVAPAAENDGGAVQRHRQHEAIVVIGVFSDEIHAAGGADFDELGGGGIAETSEEFSIIFVYIHIASHNRNNPPADKNGCLC